MAISVVQVNENSAQLLANETGKVVYLRGREGYFGDLNEWMRAEMTTDRQEAITWGQFTAIAPAMTEHQHDADMLGANLRVLAEETGMAPTFARWPVRQEPHWPWTEEQALAEKLSLEQAATVGKGYMRPEPDPEPQLRVVRVLEYRGPKKWIEQTLKNGFVKEENGCSGEQSGGHWEIVEQIRMCTRLCRWCGEDHMDRQSELECGANPRKGRY
jgi:hypothetical protein